MRFGAGSRREIAGRLATPQIAALTFNLRGRRASTGRRTAPKSTWSSPAAGGGSRIAVECKTSTAPRVNRGLRNALADLEIDEAWIIAPVSDPYPLRGGVTVAPLASFLAAHHDRDSAEVAREGEPDDRSTAEESGSPPAG